MRQQERSHPVTPWAVVAAVLLPPLGVFLARGITPAFWLTVVLTVIGWIPGMLCALALLLVPERIPIR
ncbi:YqaE/Pmp3 family membrane protein [Sphingomonas sp. Root50]|uniref:YqaE/Pmp3 family membrane protein n=1 Tax=unclassified Sphingomonas TaxID=196159 RepID=UPI0039DFAE64